MAVEVLLDDDVVDKVEVELVVVELVDVVVVRQTSAIS